VDTGFPKRSCSTKDLERDVDSTSNDRALGAARRRSRPKIILDGISRFSLKRDMLDASPSRRVRTTQLRSHPSELFFVTVSWWRRAAIIVLFRDKTTSHDVQIGHSDLLQTRSQHVVIKRRYKNVMDDYKKRHG
jgi:hypothetical protein